MEAIMPKRWIVAISVLLLAAQLNGQEHAVVQDAFAASYKQERSGEFSRAVETLREVYSEDSYEINLRLGWLCYNAGQFTESMAYYQRSASLKPIAIEPLLGLVMPASAMGNWEMVRKQYERILTIDPMNTKANYNLGSIHYYREEYDTASKYFEKVVNLYPFDYDALLMFGWTNYRLGKLREAKVLFQKALLNSPDDQSAKEGLSLIQ